MSINLNSVELENWLKNNLEINHPKDNSGSHENRVVAIDKFPIKIYQSSAQLLERISWIENELTYPLNGIKDINVSNEDGIAIVKNMLIKLAKLRPQSTVETLMIDNFKFERRMHVLNQMVEQTAEISHVSTSPRFIRRRVIKCTKQSMLTCMMDILPDIIDGTPFLVLTDLSCAITVAFLRNLFIECGGEPDWFEHLIDFNLTSETNENIGVYILNETCDIHSAIDNLFDSFLTNNSCCIKVFAQESLKTKIKTIVEQRVNNQFKNNSLFIENECLAINNYNYSSKAFINLNAVAIEEKQAGIMFHYFRYPQESINSINKLTKPIFRIKFISIWSTQETMAHQMARQMLQSTGNISINCNNNLINNQHDSFHRKWPLKLIIPHKSQKIIMNHLKCKSMTNTSWSTKQNRRDILLPLFESFEYNAAIKLQMIIECQSGQQQILRYLDDKINSNSFLQIIHRVPLKRILIYLENENFKEDSILLLLTFCIGLLVNGGQITLMINPEMTEISSLFEQISNVLDSNGETENILHVYKYDDKERKYLNYFFADGQDYCLYFLMNDDDDDDDQQSIESLLINYEPFVQDKCPTNIKMQTLFGLIKDEYKCKCLLTIALQEYNMSKMIV